MDLIVDSGSTNATWVVVDGVRGIAGKCVTEGINPLFADGAEVDCLVQSVREAVVGVGRIERVYFYGAGCVSDESRARVADLVRMIVPETRVWVESDLMAAARALFGNGCGVACILGTGSNSAYYDGTSLIPGTCAGGFILGDEGSGAVLGKRLLSDWIKRCMPGDVYRELEERYDLSYGSIVERVYRGRYPNRYLAGFAKFIHEMRDSEYMSGLLATEFDAFFARNIGGYPASCPVGFVGSIAYYFAAELRLAAARAGYSVADIQQSPIEGLARYHGLSV